MTHHYEVQTIEAFGVTYAEERYVPEPGDIDVVTIEFVPNPENTGDYCYPHPQYSFTRTVAIRRNWEVCQQNNLDWREELKLYRVCGMCLKEYFSKETGRLVDEPFWQYGVTSSNCSEVRWFEEDEIVSVEEMQQDFSRYYEPYEI
jgi:hypothetical protein